MKAWVALRGVPSCHWRAGATEGSGSGSVVEAGESISVVPAREDLGERSAEGPGTGPVFAETAGVGERERGLESRSEHTAEEGRGEEGGGRKKSRGGKKGRKKIRGPPKTEETSSPGRKHE